MWISKKSFQFNCGMNIKELDFAVVDNDKTYHWSTCREFFHPYTARLPEGIVFVCGERKDNVAAFLNKVEQRLEIPERRQSQFAYTNRNRILWIYPSRWWLQYSIRRSLFTALLRAGVRYHLEKDDFDEALYGSQYLRDTQYAVKRFMGGYTKCTSRITGWLNTFYWGGPYQRYSDPPTKKQIREMLVKP